MTAPKSILFLLAVSLAACHPKNNEASLTDSIVAEAGARLPVEDQDYQHWFQIESYLADDNIPSDSIQEIDISGVIVINPTPAQIKSLMKENGEAFYTIADDASFYQASAMAQFDSLAVKTIVADKRYLKLKGKEKSWLIDIRQQHAPEWNMIFFDQQKAPKVMPAIDVTPEELLNYFGSNH
jgi:hypothetical protein